MEGTFNRHSTESSRMTCSIFRFNKRHLRLMEERARCGDSYSYGDCAGFGEKSLPVRKPVRLIQALMVLVNRGMTVGTPDVVTAISMVKNDEIDKFVASKKKSSRIILGNRSVSKNLGPKALCGQCQQHDVTLESDLQEQGGPSCSDLAGSDCP